MSKAKLFVKFSKFNVGTIAGLINKTVKFSTAYEWNDPNELNLGIGRNLSGCVEDSKYRDDFLKFITKVMQDPDRLVKLKQVRLLGLPGTTYDNWKKIIEGNTPEVIFEQHEKIIPDLVDIVHLSSVKMFCVSSATVFDDDSAQIMFSHYADNWQGIACIYEITSADLGYVKYQHQLPVLINEIDSTMRGKVDKNFFRTKSCQWRYEKEYRIIRTDNVFKEDSSVDANGCIPMDKCGITLKAILYTPNLADTNKEILKQINDKFYDNTIELKEVTANVCSMSGGGEYFLRCADKDEVKVIDWIKKKYVNKNVILPKKNNISQNCLRD
jgi:hypothetical protein